MGINEVDGIPIMDEYIRSFNQGAYGIYYRKRKYLQSLRWSRLKSGLTSQQWKDYLEFNKGSKDYFIERYMIPFYESMYLK